MAQLPRSPVAACAPIAIQGNALAIGGSVVDGCDAEERLSVGRAAELRFAAPVALPDTNRRAQARTRALREVGDGRSVPGPGRLVRRDREPRVLSCRDVEHMGLEVVHPRRDVEELVRDGRIPAQAAQSHRAWIGHMHEGPHAAGADIDGDNLRLLSRSHLAFGAALYLSRWLGPAGAPSRGRAG